MNSCKYLQESLNFSDAIKQIKQQRSIRAQSEASCKSPSARNDSYKYPAQNSLGGTKYTQRTNLTLKQLLRQYVENSQNQYVLTLGRERIQNKNLQIFYVWISQFNQKQHQQPQNCSSNKLQNGAVQKYSHMANQQNKLSFGGQDQNRGKSAQFKIQNVNSSGKQQKSAESSDSKAIQGDRLKYYQQNMQAKVIPRPQTYQSEDEVVQQVEEPSFKDKECIVKQRLIQKVGQEMDQRQQQNVDPNQIREQKQVKGLEFSKIKRFKGGKRKRKAQI